MFDGPFGFGGFGMPRRGRRKQKAKDLVYPLSVTLEDLYNGRTAKVELNRQVLCAKCDGQGGKPGAMQSCRTCKGSGMKVELRPLGPGMMQQVQSVCPDCHGEGEIINESDRCRVCNGRKVIKEDKEIEVHVDKGMKNGHKVTMRGEGDQMPGGDAGDIIVVLQMEAHETFDRHGNDLHMTHQLGITEALCGFKFVVKHLDKRDLVISSPPGTVISPSSEHCVLGEGMPIHRNPFEKGDLYIKFEIVFPPNKFSSDDGYKQLEALLPPRDKTTIPEGEHVEEVDLMDYESSGAGSSSGARREVYNDNDDDEDEPGAQRVQCASQ